MSEPRHTLDELQRWMQAVITHPAGPAAAISSEEAAQQIAVGTQQIERVICRSQALTSFERLDIYYHTYYARLLDCLREEYSVLAFALGAELFDSFAVVYLREHPPQSYTLGQLGARFPEFLEATKPPPPNEAPHESDWPEFMIDLARLERVVNEVFDGPGMEGRPVLDAARLTAIHPEHWPTAWLVVAPCIQLLSLRFPVSEYFTAASRKETAPLPAPAATYLAVARRNYRVRRMELTSTQFELLHALSTGASVGEAISRAARTSEAPDDEFANQLHDWFRQWAADGFFIDLNLSTPGDSR
jgi:hypothetical protein